ncbi:MAG: rcc01693 family protein [Pseudomonadota bacterium]
MDWAGLMRVGLGVLRLSPEAFWSMTPREFAAACSAFDGPETAPAMARTDLEALMARFPDQAGG